MPKLENPLTISRAKLCLQYALSISITPNNPEFDCIYTGAKPNRYLKGTSSQQLRIQISQYFVEPGITLPTIHERSLDYPPCHSLHISVNTDLNDLDRHTTTPKALRLLFCELRNKCTLCVKYYTDGPIIRGNAGCLVVINSGQIAKERVSDSRFIFTCVAKVILHTFKIILDHHDTVKSPVFSNLMSCLIAIKNQFTTNPIIQNICQALDNLYKSKLASFGPRYTLISWKTNLQIGRLKPRLLKSAHRIHH